jgi:2'-5' RNA ligase
MKRTFIAVKVDAGERLRGAIISLKEGLGNEKIKWVDFNNLHVTLAFIGDTHESTINDVGSMLKKDFAGFGNITFSIRGFGVFRNFRDPKVIFSGIENSEKLIEAHEIVRKGLWKLDIKTEDRQFNPHLTIGRTKEVNNKKELQELITKFTKEEFQHVTLSEVIYYESVLLPAGPIYKPISHICLNYSS